MSLLQAIRLCILKDQQGKHSYPLQKPLLLAALLTSVTSMPVLAEQTANKTDADTNKLEQATPATKELPNPLSLQVLFDEFSQQSPAISIQQAGLAKANTALELNQVNDNLQLSLQGRLARREFAEEGQPHNMLALHVGKVLYDFGRNESQYSADQKLQEKAQIAVKLAENRQRLEVAKSYFNVLLADFQYRIDNEAMAIDYIGFDKTTDRHKIGLVSDVELLKAEHNYQMSLLKRTKSGQDQLKTRIALANTLAMPDARPDELKFPSLQKFNKRSVKGISLEELQNLVIAQNPEVQQSIAAAESQQKLYEKAQNVSQPTLRADAWVGQLSSQPEVREGRWKAQLSVDIPLYDGGLKASKTASAKAELIAIEANKQQLLQNLRNEVADIYFQLKLLAAEKKVHQAFGDYADLYLDFSRALYENESQTDLGDSFVRLSQANYNTTAWQFKQALLWMQLDYLMGVQVSLSAENSYLMALSNKDKSAKQATN